MAIAIVTLLIGTVPSNTFLGQENHFHLSWLEQQSHNVITAPVTIFSHFNFFLFIPLTFFFISLFLQMLFSLFHRYHRITQPVNIFFLLKLFFPLPFFSFISLFFTNVIFHFHFHPSCPESHNRITTTVNITRPLSISAPADRHLLSSQSYYTKQYKFSTRILVLQILEGICIAICSRQSCSVPSITKFMKYYQLYQAIQIFDRHTNITNIRRLLHCHMLSSQLFCTKYYQVYEILLTIPSFTKFRQ